MNSIVTLGIFCLTHPLYLGLSDGGKEGCLGGRTGHRSWVTGLSDPPPHCPDDPGPQLYHWPPKNIIFYICSFGKAVTQVCKCRRYSRKRVTEEVGWPHTWSLTCPAALTREKWCWPEADQASRQCGADARSTWSLCVYLKKKWYNYGIAKYYQYGRFLFLSLYYHFNFSTIGKLISASTAWELTPTIIKVSDKLIIFGILF